MPHPIHIACFFVGASLACSFLSSLWGGSPRGWLVVAFAGAVATALWLLFRWSLLGSGAARWAARCAVLPLVGLYALWAYLATAFGWLLAWTLPAHWIGAVAMLAAASAVGMFRSHVRLRVPAVLPLGLLIACLLSGWLREETRTRCDDYLAIDEPVEIAVVTTPNLESCRSGRWLPSGRYPRTIWQAAEGGRIVFSSQGAATPGGLNGSVCEAWLDGRDSVRCIGRPQGKSQALIEVREYDRLLAMQYGLPGPRGVTAGVVMELPLHGRIEILAEHWFDEHVGEGFYDARASTLYMYSDRMNGVHPATLPSFERAPTIPFRGFAPGETQYDQQLGEGVACGGPSGVAIRGAPFSARYLATDQGGLIGLLPRMSWGCDWDPVSRKVYVATPNLGLLLRIDFDDGTIERAWFVGLGMRSVEYDAARKRVYMTNFLRGTVTSFDEVAERVTGRWFVGRFSRWVRLTREGDALLASGNMGIARIALN